MAVEFAFGDVDVADDHVEEAVGGVLAAEGADDASEHVAHGVDGVDGSDGVANRSEGAEGAKGTERRGAASAKHKGGGDNHKGFFHSGLSFKKVSLEVAEEGGSDEQADAQAVVELVVVEHALAVAVVPLEHEELVVAFEEAVSDVDDGVEVEVPSLSFDQGDVEDPSSVGRFHLEAGLVDAAVLEDVFVLLAVDECKPVFCVHHDQGVDVGGATDGEFVPAAVGGFVASVAFVFEQQGELPDKSSLDDDEFAQAEARVEVEVVEGEGFLEDVPHGFLRVEQVEVGVEGQRTLGEALPDADLELHVTVVAGGFSCHGGADGEVVVFVESEERSRVEVAADAVGVPFVLVADDHHLRSRGDAAGGDEECKQETSQLHK